MDTCKKYDDLCQEWKDEIGLLIRKMCGKSHIADISICESDIQSYAFKVQVNKYNNSGSRGWATVGYIRHDLFKGSKWRLTYQPRLKKGEKLDMIGKTGSYS